MDVKILKAFGFGFQITCYLGDFNLKHLKVKALWAESREVNICQLVQGRTHGSMHKDWSPSNTEDPWINYYRIMVRTLVSCLLGVYGKEREGLMFGFFKSNYHN